jgi:NADH dehydrogenase
VKFVQGSAEVIDEKNKQVVYSNIAGIQGKLSYDRLVLAAGSKLMRPPLEGLQEHAFDVDEIESATELEAHIKALKKQPASAARNTVVVIGGGFTGIETATEMPARLRAALGDDADIRVVVIERAAQIGAALGDGIRPSIVEASEHLGIEWLVGATTASVDAGGVTLADGRRIESSTVIWTVGFRAHSLTEQVQGTRDHQGRLHVDQHLKVRGHADVYATGDTAYAATDDLGNFAAMSCQHAIALGRYGVQPTQVRHLPGPGHLGRGVYRGLGSPGETGETGRQGTQDPDQLRVDLPAGGRSCHGAGRGRPADSGGLMAQVAGDRYVRFF